MSRTSKGNTLERQAKAILESDGWTVFRQHRRPIFIKGKMITIGADIFGADLIAKKSQHFTRWINVTTQDNKWAKIREFSKYPWNYECESVEVWCKVKRGAFRIYRGKSWEEIEK